MKRTVLITGCSSGFGKELVPALASRGWRVIAGVRGGRERAGELDAEVVDLDITDDAQRRAVVAGLERLDCLINNAGSAIFGPFEECSEREIRELVETNLFGALLLTRECLPLLRAVRGRIVNVSSIFGVTGFPMTSLYCATKFALEGWSESLHHELRPHAVRVTLVEPGGFRTKFGANARWPERRLDAYVAQRSSMAAFRERIAARRGKSPQPVVRAVTRLVESEANPIRIRVGSDARATWLLRKWLPEAIGNRVMSRAFDRLTGARR